MQDEPIRDSQITEEEEREPFRWPAPRRVIAFALAVILVLGTTGISYWIRSVRERKAEEEPVFSEDLTEEEIALLKDTKNEITIAYNKSVELLGEEKYDEAFPYVMKCLDSVRKAECPNLYSDLYLKKACIEVYRGDMNAAKMSLNEAIRTKGDLSEAYLLLAGIYSDEGDLKQASDALTRYIEISGDLSAYYNLAVWAMQSEDFALSKEYFTSYIDLYLHGGADEARYFRGVCSLALEEYEDAIADFTVCVTKSIYAADSLFDRGLCYILIEDYENALNDFDLCVYNGISVEESTMYLDMCLDVLGE